MKKTYIILATLAVTIGGFAQNADSLLRRQMRLERDFNPTLLDANKINSLPALPEPTVRKANANYSDRAERMTPPIEIAIPSPGDFMTAVPYSKKRGFLTFNAGNYANLDGAFGYRLVEKENDQLSFSFLHNSTNGSIKYLQPATEGSAKAFFMDNQGGLDYRHLGESLTLGMELSYLHSLFNYYGNRFEYLAFYDDENQRLGVLHAKVKLASLESETMNYSGFVSLRNFTTSYGETIETAGIKGNEIEALVALDKPFGTMNSSVGIDGNIFTTFYNGNTDNYFLLNAAPYLRFGTKETYARLGADILFQNYNGARFRVAPHVKMEWAITDYSNLYANIHGGFKNNTFLEMVHESRYVRPYGNVKSSFSIIDMEAGAHIGEISGFRFDLFGGFRKTDDEHFLILNGMNLTGENTYGPYKEFLKPVYGNLSHTHIGAQLSTNIWSPLELSIRIKKNIYNVKDIMVEENSVSDPKAYNLPSVEADLRAELTLTEYLKLTASYYFAGDRWSYYNSNNVKMDNINDLNAGAQYKINEIFSINLRVNNLLSQKYDIWYGHPAQGFNASGGFSVRF